MNIKTLTLLFAITTIALTQIAPPNDIIPSDFELPSHLTGTFPTNILRQLQEIGGIIDTDSPNFPVGSDFLIVNRENGHFIEDPKAPAAPEDAGADAGADADAKLKLAKSKQDEGPRNLRTNFHFFDLSDGPTGNVFFRAVPVETEPEENERIPGQVSFFNAFHLKQKDDSDEFVFINQDTGNIQIGVPPEGQEPTVWIRQPRSDQIQEVKTNNVIEQRQNRQNFDNEVKVGRNNNSRGSKGWFPVIFDLSNEIDVAVFLLERSLLEKLQLQFFSARNQANGNADPEELATRIATLEGEIEQFKAQTQALVSEEAFTKVLQVIASLERATQDAIDRAGPDGPTNDNPTNFVYPSFFKNQDQATQFQNIADQEGIDTDNVQGNFEDGVTYIIRTRKRNDYAITFENITINRGNSLGNTPTTDDNGRQKEGDINPPIIPAPAFITGNAEQENQQWTAEQSTNGFYLRMVYRPNLVLASGSVNRGRADGNQKEDLTVDVFTGATSQEWNYNASNGVIVNFETGFIIDITGNNRNAGPNIITFSRVNNGGNAGINQQWDLIVVSGDNTLQVEDIEDNNAAKLKLSKQQSDRFKKNITRELLGNIEENNRLDMQLAALQFDKALSATHTEHLAATGYAQKILNDRRKENKRLRDEIRKMKKEKLGKQSVDKLRGAKANLKLKLNLAKEAESLLQNAALEL